MNKKKYQLLVPLLLSLNFIACKSSEEWNKQSFTLPNYYGRDSLNFDQEVSITDSSIAFIDWRNYFKEPELLEYIELGLNNNFDIQQTILKLEILNQQYQQSKLEWLPDLNIGIGSNHQYRSNEYYSNPSSNWYNHQQSDSPTTMYVQAKQNTAQVNLSWEVDLWGKIKLKKEAKKYQWLESEAEAETIHAQVIAEIVASYYRLLLLKAQLEVAERNFHLSQNTLHIVELQYESGNTTALAIQQTKSQMLNAKALIPNLEEKIALEENRLSFITGTTPRDIKVERTTLWSIETETKLSTGVPLELISFRPDIKAKEMQLKTQNSLLGVAKKNRYPSIKIDLSTGTNAMLMEQWFNIPGAIFGSIIGGITQPVFNKNRLKTEYEVAKINRNQAELDFQKTAFWAVKEISDMLISIDALEKQINIGEELVNNTILGIRQSNLLFNSGYATYLEIINAQKDALDSELKLNDLKYSLLIAHLNLYRSLGGGRN